MAKGLILTMGNSPDPLIFSIKRLEANYVVFIGTQESFRNSLDITVAQSGLSPNQYDRLEIADSPEEIGPLCALFQKAKHWLEAREVSQVVADPTGGRKWMSAGAVMAASFLGIPMFYVDAQYKEGKVIPDTMKTVSLGNAYDQTGFVVAAQGREAYNDSNFEEAAGHFSRITPTLAHQKLLYQGLAGVCTQLARWDRFEHYSSSLSNELEDAIQQIETVLKSGGGDLALADFVKNMRLFRDYLVATEATKQLLVATEATKQLSISFIADIFQNAKRCIIRNRYDDAVARLYRTLEAISQYLLKHDFEIDTDEPSYEKLDKAKHAEFSANFPNQQVPKKLDLMSSMILLNVLGSPAITGLFPSGAKKSFTFNGLLEKRNSSILAHGLKPIDQKGAEKFAEKLEQLLTSLFGEEFEGSRGLLLLPALPTLGF